MLRKIVLNTVTIFLAVLLSFGIIEAILRLAGYNPVYVNPLAAFHRGDSILGWTGVPDFAARFKRSDVDALIHMDENGFREKDCKTKPAETAYTILFLGDSFTWGWGVKQGGVFSDLLQDGLGSQFNIVNRGVNAYGTLQERMLLEREIEVVKPRRVGLLFYLNDFRDNADPDNLQRPFRAVEDGSVALKNCPVANEIGGTFTFVRRSYAASFITYHIECFIRSMAAAKSERIPDPNLVQIMRVTLAEMKSVCDSHGAGFFVVYVPSLQYDLNAGAESDYLSILKDLCSEQKIDLIDLVGIFRSAQTQMREEGKSLYYLKDSHWTVEGHALAARVIQEFISNGLNAGDHPPYSALLPFNQETKASSSF